MVKDLDTGANMGKNARCKFEHTLFILGMLLAGGVYFHPKTYSNRVPVAPPDVEIIQGSIGSETGLHPLQLLERMKSGRLSVTDRLPLREILSSYQFRNRFPGLWTDLETNWWKQNGVPAGVVAHQIGTDLQKWERSSGRGSHISVKPPIISQVEPEYGVLRMGFPTTLPTSMLGRKVTLDGLTSYQLDFSNAAVQFILSYPEQRTIFLNLPGVWERSGSVPRLSVALENEPLWLSPDAQIRSMSLFGVLVDQDAVPQKLKIIPESPHLRTWILDVPTTPGVSRVQMQP
jgi:hypothetical protein